MVPVAAHVRILLTLWDLCRRATFARPQDVEVCEWRQNSGEGLPDSRCILVPVRVDPMWVHTECVTSTRRCWGRAKVARLLFGPALLLTCRLSGLS